MSDSILERAIRERREAIERAERAEAAVERLTRALRVASHRPHDQLGEPDNGFPVCSVCGAIQTEDPKP